MVDVDEMLLDLAAMDPTSSGSSVTPACAGLVAHAERACHATQSLRAAVLVPCWPA